MSLLQSLRLSISAKHAKQLITSDMLQRDDEE